jgi:hypothetical protein
MATNGSSCTVRPTKERSHPSPAQEYRKSRKSRGVGEARMKKYPIPGSSSTNQYEDRGKRRR